MIDKEIQEILEQVRRFVHQTFLYARPDAEVRDDELLVDEGIVDSLGVAELVEFIESAFGVKVSDEDITEDNLGSLIAISRFVAARS